MEENKTRLDQEALESVTGGSSRGEWIGYPPGSTCPMCRKGKLVAETSGFDKDGENHFGVCDSCGERFCYHWRFLF